MSRQEGTDFIDFNVLSGIFNITARVNLTREEEEDFSQGYYDDDEKIIVINLFNIKNNSFPEQEIRRTIIHELAHLFDYNCWQSWAYKSKDAHEHYAVFTELYHDIIEDITKQLQPKIEIFLKETEKEVDKNE